MRRVALSRRTCSLTSNDGVISTCSVGVFGVDISWSAFALSLNGRSIGIARFARSTRFGSLVACGLGLHVGAGLASRLLARHTGGGQLDPFAINELILLLWLNAAVWTSSGGLLRWRRRRRRTLLARRFVLLEGLLLATLVAANNDLVHGEVGNGVGCFAT